MHIDFKTIRTIGGKASTGFEELVCQLAGLEPRPAGARFHRKGPGKDGGLECFTRFADGEEYGWQAKYSWSFDGNLERSLHTSVKSALGKHPKLLRIFVCLPFDLSDPFSTNETQLEAFERWRASEVAAAIYGAALQRAAFRQERCVRSKMVHEYLDPGRWDVSAV
ncbi:MAG: hypothetical protein QE284_08005 [Rhizobium sp.]|nr:hypothetical protein [Rhizobium sp.]